jgi:iron complex transport system substrate-binding protein
MKEIEMRFVLLTLGCILAIAVTACGSDADAVDPTQEVVSTAVTVTDMLGRSVTFDSTPTKIVTVSPTATEVLYTLGVSAIGRDTSSHFPPEVESVQEVGGAYSPSFEVIAGLQPDLVLIEALTQGHLVDAFEATGAEVVAVRAASLGDVTASITMVASIVGEQQKGAASVASIEAEVQKSRDSVTGSPSILMLISDADRNIYAAKPESYTGAVASTLGLTNLASGMPDSGPFPGFALLSAEQLISLNPDYLFTISPAPPPAPRLSDSLVRIPGLNALTAVTGGKVLELDTALFLNSPGPRLPVAVSDLAEFIASS